MAKRVGDGTTLTFGTSSIALELTSIGWDGISRETSDSSSLTTSTYKTFIVNKLIDSGEIQMEGPFDGTLTLPIKNAFESAATETVTLLFGDGTQLQAPGAITAFSVKIGLGEVNTFSATVKLCGAITWDYTA